jgi:hypothetical protein
MLTEAKRKALEGFESKKKVYQTLLDNIIGNRAIRGDDDGRERYNVVIGENAILARIERMLDEARQEVLAMVTERDLASFYHDGRADQLLQLSKKGIVVELKTSCKNLADYVEQDDDRQSSSSMTVMMTMLLKTMEKAAPTTFVLVDNKEMIVLLESNPFKKSELCGFYTNNQSLISVFKFMFKNI